ncbi:MAG TPA: hypothetical protein VKR58_06140 [Aquella sp.]|nr:hypothetical protein [Aquella sp.]
MKTRIDDLRDNIVLLAFLTEDKQDEEGIKKLKEIRLDIQDNFREYYNALLRNELQEIESITDISFHQYSEIDINCTIPNIPQHELNRETLEKIDRELVKSYNSISGAYAESKAILTNWTSKLDRCERIFRALTGFQTATKSKALFDATLSRTLTQRYDELSYYVTLFEQRIKGLVTTKELLGQMVQLYISDIKNENFTSKSGLKTHETRHFGH